MSTSVIVRDAPASAQEERSRFRYVNLAPAALTLMGLVVVYASWRLYQQVFGWRAGLDSTTPEFELYWIPLLKLNIAVNLLAWVVAWAWLWRTRDRRLDALQPRDELKRYFYFVAWLLCYGTTFYFAGSFFVEGDAAWHQTVVRDTSFTPSHIVLFYGCIPLFILFGVGAFLYSMTRLPRYAERISVPLLIAVVGPFLILPNLGYNEWGHAFWMTEELFSAPLHWGFVVLGWSLLAAGGVLVQLVQYMLDLFRRIAQQQGVPFDA
jgi:methane/ammonia monooxygenase subunit C